MKNFAKLCTPAKIYFAIAVIAAIIALFNGIGILAVLLKLFFAFIWTMILGWLCKKGWHSLSWFLVLLPYIIILLAMLRIMRLSAQQRQALNSIQLQGPLGKEHMRQMREGATTMKKPTANKK
jgi:hypothetical protein